MTKSVPGGPRATNRLRKILRSRAEICVDAETVFHARTIDISLVGMSLMSPQELGDGASLTVVFQIPTQGKLETIRAAASVLYRTPDGDEGFRLGLRFSEPDARRSDLINSLL
ncbi:MAG: PilZ domain-containing protein [Pseudomonadota bacterium]